MLNKIIAIDPGYDRIGIAILENGTLIHSECFEPTKGDFPKRLLSLYEHLLLVIKKFKPESLALETLYFSKNQKTAIKVAEARGIAELAASASGIDVFEYSPQAVKIAVTGSGNAPKEAVIRMVNQLMKLPARKRLDDEYDAIALGVAHHASARIAIHKPR